nr:hypothetical protein [Tanacetum cinerariifolium]
MLAIFRRIDLFLFLELMMKVERECNALKSQGLDLISHCKIRVGNGMSTSFWHDQWLGDSCLRLSYPRLFALENNKVCTVAAKMSAPFVSSLRRDVRGGEESAQLSRISDLLDTVVLSNMGDHRFWDLNGDGCFRIKDVRRTLDDMLLPKSDVPSRWVKQIPIKILLGLFVIGGAWFETLLIRTDLGYLGLIWFSFNQVRNRCWKECFTLPGGVYGHIETISSSLIQIFEKMILVKHLKHLRNHDELANFVKLAFDNACKVELYVEHHGYDIINEGVTCTEEVVDKELNDETEMEDISEFVCLEHVDVEANLGTNFSNTRDVEVEDSSVDDKFKVKERSCTSECVEVYYECKEPFKSLKCLWVRSKSIAATWLEEVVTPLIEPGFAAASAVLKPKHLKVDRHDMSEPMSYYLID